MPNVHEIWKLWKPQSSSVDYLEDDTVSSHFKWPAWMITSNKVGWSIPGSKNRFAYKLWTIVLQSWQRYTSYPRDLPMHRHNKCNNADKACWKIIQIGDSTVTGWSSAISLGQDTVIIPPPSNFHCGEVSPIHQDHNCGWWENLHQGQIHGVGQLLIDKSSKLSMFMSNHGYLASFVQFWTRKCIYTEL